MILRFGLPCSCHGVGYDGSRGRKRDGHWAYFITSNVAPESSSLMRDDLLQAELGLGFLLREPHETE